MAEKTTHSTAPLNKSRPLAIVSGGARRIGAAISRQLHAQGFDLLLHYNNSVDDAQNLCATLNAQTPASCRLVQADLANRAALLDIMQVAVDWHPEGAAVLVNNASTYYPTPLAELSEPAWEDLRKTNLDAPLWLCQSFAKHPAARCIINIADAMTAGGLPRYAAYAAAKHALQNLTQSLARELAPRIRVNAIAPGSMLWADPEPSDEQKQRHLAEIPLGRQGSPTDIAQAVSYLIEADYVTGHVLYVDGGRSLGAP